MAENKIDVSIPRHLYWVDSLTQKNKCPRCGKKDINGLELTEYGQTQVAELYFTYLNGVD